MSVQLLSIEESQVKIEVTIALSRSMLTSEEAIQQSLNQGGLPPKLPSNTWIRMGQPLRWLER